MPAGSRAPGCGREVAPGGETRSGCAEGRPAVRLRAPKGGPKRWPQKAAAARLARLVHLTPERGGWVCHWGAAGTGGFRRRGEGFQKIKL